VHAGHRISFDHDHVVKDLAKNYDAAIRALESIAGWHTQRRVKGKMVLGNVNKIAAGLRNHLANAAPRGFRPQHLIAGYRRPIRPVPARSGT
jgi:hypothetical protein